MINSYVPKEVAVDDAAVEYLAQIAGVEDRCSGFGVELRKGADGDSAGQNIVRVYPLTNNRDGKFFDYGPTWTDLNPRQHHVPASVSILKDVSVSPGFMNFGVQDPDCRHIASVKISGPVGLTISGPKKQTSNGLTVLIEPIESAQRTIFKVVAHWDSSRLPAVKETIRLRCEGLPDPTILELPLYVEGAVGPRITKLSNFKLLTSTQDSHDYRLAMLFRIRGMEKVTNVQSRLFSDEWSPGVIRSEKTLIIQQSSLSLPSTEVTDSALEDTLTFTFSDGWTEAIEARYELAKDVNTTPK